MRKHVLDKRPVFVVNDLAEVLGDVVAHSVIFGSFVHHGEIGRRDVEGFLVSVIVNTCENRVSPQLLYGV